MVYKMSSANFGQVRHLTHTLPHTVHNKHTHTNVVSLKGA